MKNVTNLKLGLCILSLVILGMAAIGLTGCSDDGRGGSGGNGGTNAPTSIAGRSITHSITSGSAPLPTGGTFVLHAGGNAGDVSGSYTITGSGGVTNSAGTYTYTLTDFSTATLILLDSTSNQQTDESLLFQTPSSGTFSASAGGGTQSGTFILQ